MDYGKHNGGYVAAIKSDGTTVALNADYSCTLADSTTYYVPFGSSYAPTPSQAAFVGCGLRWAAAVVATITIECTNFPAQGPGAARGGGYDVTDYEATTSCNWVNYAPAGAYVPVGNASGSSNSASGTTVTAAGSVIGTALYDVAGTSARRWRIKLVVTTGGKVWSNVHGKAGG